MVSTLTIPISLPYFPILCKLDNLLSHGLYPLLEQVRSKSRNQCLGRALSVDSLAYKIIFNIYILLFFML